MLTDTRQLFEASEHAEAEARRYRGGMTWKTSSGAEYLIRIVDSRGKQKSLGRRSAETQATYESFVNGKRAAAARIASLRGRLEEQARFNKAARIGRVPTVAAKILRKLDRHKLLGRGLRVIGTNALYAYEAEAAVVIERGLTATTDIDLLWDVNRSLQLTGEAATAGLLGLLRTTDATFVKAQQYRAINNDGYFVDLVRAPPSSRHLDDGKHAIAADEGDLQAVEIEGLEWLTNLPAFSAVAVGEDGYPVRIEAPHPVGFALHKKWLSGRPDREAAKRRRDRGQGELVLKLVENYLPAWRYDDALMQALPQRLRELI